jgi:hypothetical protein
MMLKILVFLFFIFHSCVADTTEWCAKHDYTKEIKPEDSASKIAKCSARFEELVSGRYTPGSSDRPSDLLPPWVNLTLARQGQEFAKKHEELLGGSAIFGLIFVLAFPGINEVLLFTNQSETAEKAAKRYGSTIEQVRSWYENTLKEGEDDNGALKTLLRVRGLHLAAAKSSKERLAENRTLIEPSLFESVKLDEEMWNAFKKDLDDSNIPATNRVWPSTYTGRQGEYVPVSQFQQAVTQFAFVGFPVLFPKRINLLDASDEDLWAFNHLWAVLGYAVGIDDKYNVALQPDLAATRAHYQKIFEQYYLPGMFNLDFHAKILLEAQLNGFRQLQPILTPKTLLLRLLKDIADIPAPNMAKVLSPEDHAKMLQYYVTGLKGFMEKIREYSPQQRKELLKKILPSPPLLLQKAKDRIDALRERA